MVDVHSPERRSGNMRAIRSKNTQPEIVLRKLLFARGFRFRLHAKNLPGKPDIVLSKFRVAIFMHGCFWHGHNCHLFKLPKTRQEFWKSKIDTNQSRDIRDTQLLLEQGWRILVVWECALKGRASWHIADLGNYVETWIRDVDNIKPSLFEIKYCQDKA